MRETGPNAILKNQPELRCEFFGISRRVEHVWGWQFMAALARSKIGLNLSSKPTPFSQGNGSDTYFYSSDRVALLMGNGLLTFAERGFCLSELYGNHRLIEFEATAEFVDKVAHFSRKDEARRAIAECGHEFVHREFNERIGAQYLMEALFDETFSRRYAWPSRCYSAISQTALDSAAVP